MKNILAFIFIVLFAGCISKRFVKRSFAENKVEVHTNFEKALASKTSAKSFMLMVFNTRDSLLYNLPITSLLKIDSTKNDVLVYNSLARDFSVVKLYRQEFDAILNNETYFDSTFRKAFSDYEYDASKSFLFISGSPPLYFYFARPLDSPKEVIHNIIWVKFGP